ncbi:hypothetical protein Cme02nite_51760 [Catellatospora methionotrophica]|uniref:Lipoprotein n=1 Tax=Catellatospora methionotrophica TaxID=121620 RepID=A0A8J3LDX8_9ACTN|nr:hypothetical protein [Catellatospora methionotrophica]GIG16844.1 hypothetical protein Cme02nite_51760 [Catellatospora methionotrophica]
MRRFLTAVLVATALLGASACGADEPGPASSPGTAAAPAPTGSTGAKAVCAEFDKVFNGKARTDLATAIGGVLTARSGKDAAKTQAAETKLREALTALDTQIAGVGAVAADPAVKSAFDQVAANVRQSGVDLAFLEGVSKLSELEAKLTPVLLSWIMPLAKICP